MLTSLGEFCYRRRGLAVIGWLVLLALGLAFGSSVFGRLTTTNGGDQLDSVRAQRLLDDSATTGPQLYAVVDRVDAASADLTRALNQAETSLRAVPGVATVAGPFDPGAPRQLMTARDGRAVVVDLRMVRGETNKQIEQVLPQLRSAFDPVRQAVPGAQPDIGGNAPLFLESNQQTEADLRQGEAISLPIAAVVLVLIFGGLVGAGLPLAAALASIAGALLALLGFSAFMPVDSNVVSVVTVMGLGLAIDYGLLMVSRYREERSAGLDGEAAVVRTVQTAGRAITFSALTVATAVSGLFFFPQPYRSMGAGGVSVVLLALLAGLTLVPPLLSMTGDRLMRGMSGPIGRRLPDRVRALAGPPPADGFFSRITRRAQRHPVPIVVTVVVVLAALGAPFVTARYVLTDPKGLPHSFASYRAYTALQTRFDVPQENPIEVVLPGMAPSDPRVASYAAELAALPGVSLAQPVQRSAAPAVIDVDPVGATQGDTAQALVHQIRAHPRYGALLAGTAAVLVDFKHEVAAGLPWAAGFIALATFVLLFLMTGSLLIPLKALVMNVLSLGASFGALVWIFQDGHLRGLLGFTPEGGLETWMPVIVFVFAFGLSMDYEVFLLSRIKELYDAGHGNDESVAMGLQRSGRIITSAALLIVIVFAGFATGQMLGIKEMGLALSIAVLVDATLVRCLLVPATMTLMGRWNWWAPGPLRRLHNRLGLREAPAAPLPQPPEPAEQPEPPEPRDAAAQISKVSDSGHQ